MLAALAKSIFGSSNDRYVRSMGKIVETIAGFEPTISAMTEIARLDPPRLAPFDQQVIDRDARERHCRRPAVELAGAAMAPAGVERLARQPVAHRAAQASAGPFHA